jgi:hypothetical protein
MAVVAAAVAGALASFFAEQASKARAVTAKSAKRKQRVAIFMVLNDRAAV